MKEGNTMRWNASTLTVLGLAALLSGCVVHVPGESFNNDNWNWGQSDWQECQDDNRRAMHRVQPGDHIDDVIGDFCEAEFREVMSRDDQRIEVLFFRLQHRRADGETTHDETMPFVFVDDLLYGRGPIAYEEATGQDFPEHWSDYRDWQDQWMFTERGWDEDDRDWSDCEDDNRWALRYIEVGDSLQDVSGEFCRPDFREMVENDGEEVEVLFFRTQHRHSDGETTRDETTPLVFVDGVLVGWGRASYEETTGQEYRSW
jgi:Protein of unknown function (DUF3192)